ncbi:MAG: copper amine oxidase N-terminal domain-containing protein, partial [Treponema sp.]|nr:copper amine oxidase N-terminal domain-containing protein [Treponema sp.]
LAAAMAGPLSVNAVHAAESGPKLMQAGSDIQVVVNGSNLYLDPAPVIESDRTLVPLRQIFEALGADVDWNGDARVVTASRGSTTVKLQIDYGSMGHTYKGLAAYERLDVPPRIIDSRTYVPLRAVSQALGADVNWEAASRTAIVTSRLPVTRR